MRLSEEFDELYRLAERIGFKGAQVEEFITKILHTVNETLKEWLNDTTGSDR